MISFISGLPNIKKQILVYILLLHSHFCLQSCLVTGAMVYACCLPLYISYSEKRNYLLRSACQSLFESLLYFENLTSCICSSLHFLVILMTIHEELSFIFLLGAIHCIEVPRQIHYDFQGVL